MPSSLAPSTIAAIMTDSRGLCVIGGKLGFLVFFVVPSCYDSVRTVEHGNGYLKWVLTSEQNNPTEVSLLRFSIALAGTIVPST